MTIRGELFQRLADQLSEDIGWELVESGVTSDEVVDLVLPKGSPGSQFHRPLLYRQIEALRHRAVPLDLVTCLQLCEAFGWPIGLLEDEDDE